MKVIAVPHIKKNIRIINTDKPIKQFLDRCLQQFFDFSASSLPASFLSHQTALSSKNMQNTTPTALISKI